LKEGSSYHYSAADIQRYLRGSMSKAEMHNLEKAALDDAFLAEALEGYRSSGVQIDNDIDALNARLSKKMAAPARVGWLTIAAAAALVISLSLAAWLLYTPYDKPTIAKLDTLEKKEPVSTTVQSANEDSLQMQQDTNSITAVDSRGPTSARKPNPVDPNAAAENTGDRLADQKNQTGPSKANQQEIAADDSRAKKEASGNEDQTRVAAAPVGKPESNAEGGKVVLSPDLPPQAKAGKARSMVGTMDRSAQPVEGWAAFQSYLSKNLNAPSGKSAGLHGKVTVSFLISKDGKPHDIQVERSLHPDYDAEAIRVLKEGPAWRPVTVDSTVRTTQIIEF
jgi:TonB family protein